MAGKNDYGIMMHIDTSELDNVVQQLHAIHTQENFTKIMRRAVNRAASRMRMVLRNEIPADYMAKPMWIRQQVGGARTQVNGAIVTAQIPVTGIRGKVGGKGEYAATASDGARNIRTDFVGRRKTPGTRQKGRTRRAYKVMASVVTSNKSALPNKGEQIHFMVFSGAKKGRTFARLPNEGNRIRPAVGIGVPQMPTNRTKEAVERATVDMLRERIEHEHSVLIRGIVK